MKCKQCSKEFIETEQERALRTKLAPEIAGKKFELPEPTLCPICRNIIRAAFRNERKLYKRKCNSCQKEMVSVYSPDKNVNALCSECFWSDKIDGLAMSVNYDSRIGFFEQFGELLTKGKLGGLLAVNNENSEYVNQEMDVKDCYMCVGGHWNQDCLHCTFSIKGDSNADCYFVWDSNNLYESISCLNCSNSQYLKRCQNCSGCYLCEDCVGCNDCFGCCNLQRKQYYFFNKPLSKEDYFATVKIALQNIQAKNDVAERFERHRLGFPKKYAANRNCEYCFGDNLAHCKNMHNCFWSDDSENCVNGYITGLIKDTLDSYSFGIAELCYNMASSAQIHRSYCSTHCTESDDVFYSSNCFNCKNIFGCVGLIKKEYCILNKQYDKEEYEQMVTVIIQKMQKDGDWGKFFPTQISIFGYNETVAQEIYPLTKDKALKLGANWQDEDFGIKYNGPFYEPKEIFEYDPERNQNAQKEIEGCLKGILKCEKTDKPYKIIPQELHYYIKHNIEIPRKHPDQRHLERLSRVNSMELYHRQCINKGCNNEFETTYSPNSPEKVYCEKCYQDNVE